MARAANAARANFRAAASSSYLKWPPKIPQISGETVFVRTFKTKSKLLFQFYRGFFSSLNALFEF